MRHNLRTIGTLKYIGRNGDDLNATPKGHATSNLNVIFGIKVGIVWIFFKRGYVSFIKTDVNSKKYLVPY